MALRELLTRDSMGFLMEAHNGMSAKVAEEAGFEGLWGSGLSISASMGVRDNNEMSWTQVLDLLEFMGDATTIPLLLDGDTGLRQLQQHAPARAEARDARHRGRLHRGQALPEDEQLHRRQPAAGGHGRVLREDQGGQGRPGDDNFSIVARVEALIAGWGLGEALKRAEAYRRAGADAILIHSKQSKPDEILAFMAEWGDRGPVVIVPTTYYSTPTEAFRDAGVSVVIWANHSMRSALTAMQQTAQQLREEESLLNVEDRIVTVKEVFRIQGASELEEAEKRYLPARQETPQALILAAGRGKELGVLTEDRPKAMVEIAGKPLLERTVDTLHSIGIKDITVVRGYRKEALQLPDLNYVDNDEHETTQEAFSLFKGLEGIAGPVLMAYGDVLFQKFIPMHLFESDADFCIAVDPQGQPGPKKNGYRDLVTCDRPFRWSEFDQRSWLVKMSTGIPDEEAHGEWIGLLKMTGAGVSQLRELGESVADPERLRSMRMADVFDLLIANGKAVEVVYIRGHWLDVDDLHDVVAASNFGGGGQYR